MRGATNSHERQVTTTHNASMSVLAIYANYALRGTRPQIAENQQQPQRRLPLFPSGSVE
jgi:hypothetical protein